MISAVEQRRAKPVLVAAIGDLADELVDQVSPVGQDEDAAGARTLDEAEGGNGLTRAGGVLEPEAAARPRILGRLLEEISLRFLPVERLLFLRNHLVLRDVLHDAVPARLAARGEIAVGLLARSNRSVGARGVRVLQFGRQRRERAGQDVDLVLGE